MNLTKPRTTVNRVEFDPSSLEHRRVAYEFFDTGIWRDVQFFVESPYIDVPSMVKAKLCEYFLIEEFRPE